MTAPVAQQSAPPGLTIGQAATYALEAAVADRGVQMAVRTALLQDVIRLWPLLDRNNVSQTFPGWLQAMTQLILRYHRQSSAGAAAFYRAARAQALQSPTPQSLIRLAPTPDPEWIRKALGFAGPGTLFKDTASPNTALSTTLGTTARIALDGGRTTMTGTAHADPAAVGYFRLTDGDPCAFCALLSARGVVYKKDSFRASDAKFVGGGADKVHNLCGCTLAPAFSRRQQLPALSGVAQDVYEQSTHGVDGKQKLVAFRRAWAERQGQGISAGPSRPSPKRTPSRPGRTPEQVRAELVALERALPDMTAQQRDFTTKRIETLRVQLGQ